MARAVMRFACGGSGGCVVGVPSLPPTALATLPHDVWQKIIEGLVGWDLLQLAQVSRVFRNELLANAALWTASLPQLHTPNNITLNCTDAKRAYALHKSFRFRGQRTDVASPHGGERGAGIEALRFLPTSRQRDAQLFVPLAPRVFSIDVWFSLQGSGQDKVTLGGILLGAQSARWQDAMVWPDYHQQFIHVGPTGDLFCSVVGDKRVVATLTVGCWYHLVLVFNTDHEDIYLNGLHIRNANGALHRDWRSLYFMQVGTGCISTGSVGIPTPKFSGWYAFNGMINELRLWDSPLTLEEIQKLAADRLIQQTPTGSLSACGSSTYLGNVQRVRCSRPRERVCIEWTK